MKLEETEIARNRIFKGHLIDLELRKIMLPNQQTAEREVVYHPAVVGALVVNQQQQVLLVQQWREPIKQLSWEIPAGLVDKTDQTPLAAMKRELNEETGYQAHSWQQLRQFYSSPGFTDEQITLFYARNLAKVTNKKAMDADEFVKAQWFDSATITEYLTNQKIVDGKTMLALSLLKQLNQ